MARFYSNENFPRRVVEAPRALGHDVLTSLEAGRANQRIPDEEVLRCATAEGQAFAGRILAAVKGAASLPGQLLRVVKPG